MIPYGRQDITEEGRMAAIQMSEMKKKFYNSDRGEEIRNEKSIMMKNRLKENPNSHPTRGKMRITNGIINKTIPKHDKIPKGWRKGMTIFKTKK